MGCASIAGRPSKLEIKLVPHQIDSNSSGIPWQKSTPDMIRHRIPLTTHPGQDTHHGPSRRAVGRVERTVTATGRRPRPPQRAARSIKLRHTCRSTHHQTRDRQRCTIHITHTPAFNITAYNHGQISPLQAKPQKRSTISVFLYYTYFALFSLLVLRSPHFPFLRAPSPLHPSFTQRIAPFSFFLLSPPTAPPPPHSLRVPAPLFSPFLAIWFGNDHHKGKKKKHTQGRGTSRILSPQRTSAGR